MCCCDHGCIGIPIANTKGFCIQPANCKSCWWIIDESELSGDSCVAIWLGFEARPLSFRVYVLLKIHRRPAGWLSELVTALAAELGDLSLIPGLPLC